MSTGTVELQIEEEVKTRPKAVFLKLRGVGYVWLPLSAINYRQGATVWVNQWWYDQTVDRLMGALETQPATPLQLRELQSKYNR